MTRLAYAWILVAVASALLFHSYEETERREAIRFATQKALSVGVKAGCEENNKIRHQVRRAAETLHGSVPRSLQVNQDCESTVRQVVDAYLAAHK